MIKRKYQMAIVVGISLFSIQETAFAETKAQFFANKCFEAVRQKTPKLVEEMDTYFIGTYIGTDTDFIILHTIRTEPWGESVKYQHQCDTNGYEVILQRSKAIESQ